MSSENRLFLTIDVRDINQSDGRGFVDRVRGLNLEFVLSDSLIVQGFFNINHTRRRRTLNPKVVLRISILNAVDNLGGWKGRKELRICLTLCGLFLSLFKIGNVSIFIPTRYERLAKAKVWSLLFRNECAGNVETGWRNPGLTRLSLSRPIFSSFIFINQI